MPFVTWSEEYSVNVKVIDQQHQKLLELVNGLHAAVESCIEKEQLRQMLVELVKFTAIHFSTEEEYMKKYDYPQLASHHREHRILLRHLNDLVNAVSGGFRPTFYSDYDVSTDWALLHIEEHDRGLGAFLNSKNVY
ncbi:MAG: hemerythrin family protein [Gammaproteobacteria bacterium]|nr:hemerythrin family protein [Gammaproteobacteria bacterium]